MFGYIQANLEDLSREEQDRYRSCYCGLCRTIGKRHGFWARLGLSYDLTYLTMLLSALYEPEECSNSCRCIVHPCKQKCSIENAFTEYAADMTVALTYYKCLDDWKDDRNLIRFLYAKLLKKSYNCVKQQWPVQCAAIERELEVISRIETAKSTDPDAAANSFGRLMAQLFVREDDNWVPYLHSLGYGLGKFIYLADAAVDYRKDRRSGSYNPLNYTDIKPEDMKTTLTGILADASRAFEFLPIVQDANILKNILYSGIWLKYNQAMEKERKRENG